MADLAGGITGALTGAIAGFLFAWVRKGQDDSKRRKAVATAQHIELRSLDAQLRVLDGLPNPSRADLEPLVRTFDMFAADLVLFDARAVASLLSLRNAVRQVEMNILELRRVEIQTAPDPRRGNFDWQVRVAARRALSAIPDVQRALLRNGAAVSPAGRLEPPCSFPDLPEMPPSPFGPG
jgi:hypothetical protein